MTAHMNPAVAYIDSASEAATQRAITELLWACGWVVIELSQPNSVKRGLIGATDLIAMKRINGGVTITWLIECKTHRGKLRKSQELFYERIQEHLSPTLRYTLARSVDEIIELIDKYEVKS